MPRARLAATALVAVTIAWGGAFVGIKVLLRSMTFVDLTLARFLGAAALFLLLWPRLRRPPPVEPRDRPRLFLLGLLGVGGYHLALNYGERTVSAGVAGLIVASVPVMVAVLSALFLGEEVTAAKALGIGVALGGVVALTLRGTPGVALRVGDAGGAAITALAPLCWAANTVLGKPLVARYGTVKISAITVLGGTLALLPLVRASMFESLARLTPLEWAWMAWLVLPCTVAGYFIWYWALRQLEASRTAAFVYLVPMWALVWAAAVLGERLTPWVLLGGAMVVGGLLLVERAGTREPAEDRV